MLSVSDYQEISTQAATTSCVAKQKVSDPCSTGLSAATATVDYVPSQAFVGLSTKLHRGEPPELLPEHSFKSSVGTCATVTRLCRSGCPVAILSCVVPVIVAALQRIANWPWSHVGKERLELHPRRIDRDTSTSIVWVVRILLVKAAGLHVCPTAVLSGMFLFRHEWSVA